MQESVFVVPKTCREELNTAREQKNDMERLYNDSLKEMEATKKECDEVKKFCEVSPSLTYLLLAIAYSSRSSEIRTTFGLPLNSFSHFVLSIIGNR